MATTTQSTPYKAATPPAKSSSGFLQTATNLAGEALGILSKQPNTRISVGITNRRTQIMTWRLPNGTTVQMYINPENFVIAESKQIVPIRTKGGFVVQYWGDNITRITLSGTTGSSGVKGINILRDIYHSENRAFELIAASQENELFNQLGSGSSSNVGQKAVPEMAQKLRERNFILRPSLGSFALGVTLYYQEASYKGFFSEMQVIESVSKLGLFDYNITFNATEIRGRRENFMPWHKEPLADDSAGQLVNAIGNAFRGFAGLSPQNPQTFHPEDAPLTFGGNSLTSSVMSEINELTTQMPVQR